MFVYIVIKLNSYLKSMIFDKDCQQVIFRKQLQNNHTTIAISNTIV